MGAQFNDSWSSDNKTKAAPQIKETKEPSKHLLTLAKEKRRGKIVTIVKPFFLSNKDLKELLKSLKKTLGCGGTIKESQLELQGDIQLQVQNLLIKKGFRFKGISNNR